MTRRFRRLTVIALGAWAMLSLVGCAPRFPVTGWPIDATGSVHQIGNSGGEFQQYGGGPYFHTGIDILDAAAPGGPWVRTTREGTPTLSLPGAGSLYNGLTVVQSDGSTYLYWHLDFNSVQQAVRDAETNGTALAANSQVARLVPWSACNYHHLHYETGDSAGKADPIYSVTPRNDTTSPIVIDIFFTQNGTNTQFPSGVLGRRIVNGNVDIIAHAYDTQFGTARTGVMNIGYTVANSSGATVLTGPTLNFRNIPAGANTGILYRNSTPFDSDSNYCGTENYYYVVTNVDASGNFNEANGFWNTAAHPNGVYRVTVTASDAAGNSFSLGKDVIIDN